MSNKDTSGPAFPTVMIGKPEGGMTLRDYFAAKAMQGMIGGTWPTTKSVQNDIAEFSYAIADAMLKARDGNS